MSNAPVSWRGWLPSAEWLGPDTGAFDRFLTANALGSGSSPSALFRRWGKSARTPLFLRLVDEEKLSVGRISSAKENP